MSDRPRQRRRAVRPSDASEIDRSWDSPAGSAMFQEPADVTDPRHSDDFVVILDDNVDEEPESGEFDEDFWKEQRPPHF
ncbi:hypothetical protein J5O04_05460 [Corynebacterium hindlerae]|uniref:hypothetical protein n=1 Tax=Corynebacterium hindlerae TaxID=699041 RepID=UPI001AD76D23|nr:hypothetical protein [Corynebacterium hindlerae]QTH60556.1 hypothetical protein J5O04_05460 [Corynebacterium hindlerae]